MIPYNRPWGEDPSLFDRTQNPSGFSFSRRFDRAKLKRIQPALVRLPTVFTEVVGTPPALPRQVYSMSLDEVERDSRLVVPHGALFEAASNTIKIDPARNAEQILRCLVVEMIHAEAPWIEEAEAQEKADVILSKLHRRGRTPTPLGLDAHCLVPGLWMGSKPEIGRVVAESGFDLLVLCAEEYQPPAWQFPGVEVIHAPFDDNDIGPLPSEKKIARSAAERVVDALGEGSNTLVTCYAGRNRSGLVCGLALVAAGHDPVRAIKLIQAKRDKALTNDWFVDLIAKAR